MQPRSYFFEISTICLFNAFKLRRRQKGRPAISLREGLFVRPEIKDLRPLALAHFLNLRKKWAATACRAH